MWAGGWAMRTLNLATYIAAGTLLALAATAPAWSAGGSPAPSGGNYDMPQRDRSPAEVAKDAYNAGIRYLKDAKEYEEDAQKAKDPKKVAKATEKSQKAYQKAQKEFVTAISKVPTMHEAWN